MLLDQNLLRFYNFYFHIFVLLTQNLIIQKYWFSKTCGDCFFLSFLFYLSLFLIPFILDFHWLCRICWICFILPDPWVLPPVIAAVYSLIKYRWIQWESSNCGIRRRTTSNPICKVFKWNGFVYSKVYSMVYSKVSTDDQLLKINARGSFSHSNVYREN